MENIKDKMTYNLCLTERIYRDNTLMSFYFQPNKKVIKKFKPVDVEGERMRLNLTTGELENYKMKDILTSYGASLRRTIICMNMLLAMNDFDWFWTLTFDKDKIDRTDDEQVFNCYKKYINNLSHKYPNFGYMSFPERHEDGCFHFHLLVNGITPKQMGLVNSGKVCCHWADKKYNGIRSKEYYEKTKHLHNLVDTDGEPIYNVTTFAYGYTTVSRIVSRERCNTYVKKYVEKALGSTEVFKKRFYYSKNLNVPEVVKRLIGEDFTTPKNIEEYLSDNEYIKNAIYEPYINDHNILQIKIDNAIKQNISRGLLPTNENINLNDIFAMQQQLKLEDIF